MTHEELRSLSISGLIKAYYQFAVNYGILSAKTFIGIHCDLKEEANQCGNEIDRRLRDANCDAEKFRILYQDRQKQLEAIDETLDQIDRANGDAPHRMVNRCDRISVVAGYPNGVEAGKRTLVEHSRARKLVREFETWLSDANKKLYAIDETLREFERQSGSANVPVDYCDRIRSIVGLAGKKMAPPCDQCLHPDQNGWISMNSAKSAEGKRAEYIASEVFLSNLEQAKQELYGAKNNT